MIVGLSGRKNTGKTTLSELLINRGFKRASFATALKEYVAQLFEWELKDLYTQKGKEETLNTPVIWNQSICHKLEDLAGLDLNFIGELQFNTRRDALQYIGTDVLRGADPNFHVNKFAEKFRDGNFVVDDVRFLNEINTLRTMNGVCIHIIRPYNWIYSNHASEISISRNDVDYLVLNDKSQEKLVRKFNLFLDNLLSKRKKALSRMELLENLDKSCGDIDRAAQYLDCSKNKIITWINRYLVDVNRNAFELEHDAFSKVTEEATYWVDIISSIGKIKKCSKYDYALELASSDQGLIEGARQFLRIKTPIQHKLLNGKITYTLTVLSPYIIDDLKLWNIEPN